jgi:single-strand DNA-binding protein
MNKIILKGRIGQDPVSKVVGDGIIICNFSIATNDGTKDKPKTNWHRCTAFKKTAEIIIKHFTKGEEILIEGSINYSKSEDKEYTNVNIHSFEFCGSKINKAIPHDAVPITEGEDDLPF